MLGTHLFVRIAMCFGVRLENLLHRLVVSEVVVKLGLLRTESLEQCRRVLVLAPLLPLRLQVVVVVVVKRIFLLFL
jgi:hypothetical protein